jgi:hypothetical protein
MGLRWSGILVFVGCGLVFAAQASQAARGTGGTTLVACGSDSDCHGHGHCSSGTCNHCGSDSDCKTGNCSSGMCGSCGSDSDCRGNGKCSSGRCGACGSDSDCPSHRCSSGRCENYYP